MYAPGQFSHLFATFLKGKSLEHVIFHDPRHSAATCWLYLGVDLKTISEMLGHSDIGITGIFMLSQPKF
jgi:site-specific recombinase XerD